MKRFRFVALALIVVFLSISARTTPAAWADPPAPLEGFVSVNGVRLQYLDWGGQGPALILLHGLADNPYIFDDLAPAFTDRFHVIAYARRGSGNSDAKGPYDVETLTEDLRGLMDALGIAKADLVGHSAGGDEITDMAAEHPERVGRLVYFDSAYDWADPEFHAVYNALPFNYFARPANAMASLDAFRSYEKRMWFRELDDTRRVEAHLRESVVIQRDGSLRDRTPKEVVDALYAALWINKRRDYTRVHCPALAFYPEHLYDVRAADAQRRDTALRFEQKYWRPFQERSIDRVQRELANVTIVRIPGLHTSFFMTDRKQVVDRMRQFLSEPSQAGGK